jgi:alkylation response protein AidB-like acyl-CoA dehydrogenase
VDFRLTDEQRQIVETARRLAQNEFKPRALKYLDGTFPHENMKLLAESGILGMGVPVEYGGSALGVLDTALVLEEVAKGCYVTAMALLGEVGVQMRIIAQFAPNPVKERVLPGIVRGDTMLAVCMTEPDSGTDLSTMRTNTTRRQATVVIEGAKSMISRAEVADMFIVFSRIDGIQGREGIGCVLVPKGTPGLDVNTAYHTMGGEYLSDVRFNGCEVPREHLIVEEDGFRRFLSIWNVQRCLNSSICLGLAEGALEESIGYMQDRQAFGRPIGEFQGLRWKMVDMLKEIEAARGLLYRACASADPFPDPMLAALAKIYCNEMAIRVTSEGIQIHGGYGYTDESPVSRHFRGARFGSLGGGTTETLRDHVAKRVFSRMNVHDGILSLDIV